MFPRGERRTGVLAEWNDERGFGFVEAGGRRTFVHISAFDTAAGRPQSGDFVEFAMGADADGRPCAVAATRVYPLQSAPAPVRHRPSGHRRGDVEWVAIGIVVAFAAYVALAIHALGVTPWVAVFYSAISLVTFAVYVADKRAALHGEWRTSERTLQLASLAGGWPGAVLAQQFVRHKNRKPSFQLTFWFAASANVVVFVVVTMGWPRLLG